MAWNRRTHTVTVRKGLRLIYYTANGPRQDINIRRFSLGRLDRTAVKNVFEEENAEGPPRSGLDPLEFLQRNNRWSAKTGIKMPS
jgi:hypothetical protein